MMTLLWTLAANGAMPASFEELARQAGEARRGNHVPEAIELYRQAVQLTPSWIEGWWFIGTLSYATYQYAGCRDAFGQFVTFDTTRAAAWSLLGLCEFETGQYDEAREHLRQGLAGKDLAPEVEAGARFHYGLLLTRAGLFEQGKRELDRYAQAGGQEPSFLTGLGVNALHESWLPNEVPADRIAVVMKAGTVARSWILGELGPAETGMQELVNEYPSTEGVHYLYGSYLSYTRPEKAVAEFRRELSLNPSNIEANALLALLMLRNNDAAGALPYAKKAVDEKASSATAEYAYGEVLIQTGDLRQGIARLEAAERLDPESLEFHMALASAYSRAGRDADARRERRQSLDMAAGKHPENTGKP